MSGARRAGPGALAALALLAMVLVTFADALRPSRALFERDILGYWYPHRVALRAALASGQLPLWNPWLGFGAPFLADASSELLYPPTWLALALPFPLQFEILAIGHCLLAAAGAALVARRLVGGVLPAAAAGGAYALAGPLLSALGLYHHFAGAALMPWVLWALEGLLQHASARRAIVLGTLAAGQVLAGSGDLVLMTALAASARLALHVGGARARGMGALVPRLALAAALAASLSAVQWLPTVERGASGLRAAQDYRTVTYWSLHPVSLVDLGVPRLVSEATLSREERLRLFEGREPLFSCLYLGVVTLALGALALVLRERLALPLAAGASLFVLLGLGRHTPIYGLLLALPGASLMRYPQKYLLPASLCVALLAAVGVGALARGWTEPERRRARALGWALLGVVLLVTAFAWRQAGDASGAVAALKLGRTALVLSIASLVLLLRGAAAAPRPGLVPAFLLLGAIDLVLVGRGTNDTAPASLYEHQPAALDRFEGPPAACTPRPRAPPASRPARAPQAGRAPGWRRSASWTRCGRPRGFASACSAATTVSSPASARASRPRSPASFTPASAGPRRCGCSSSEASSTWRTSATRLPSVSSRSPRSRRRSPARCCSCACPTRSHGPTWSAASATRARTRWPRCSTPASTHAARCCCPGPRRRPTRRPPRAPHASSRARPTR